MKALALIPKPVESMAKKGESYQSFEALTLFADISGFTALTETLMSSGVEGAESLCEILNGVFEPLVHEIHNAGGFVATFAGDALTAVFTTQDRKLVLGCVQRIHILFEKHPSLSIKTGLGCGEVELRIHSTADRSAYSVRGQAINDCAASEHLCQPGQSVLSREFVSYQKIPGSCLSKIRERFVFHWQKYSAPITPAAPPLAAPSPEIMEEFFSREILKRDYEGEFRPVICLFLNFNPPGEEETEEFIKMVLTHTANFSTTLGMIDFGDKGAKILIFSGAPIALEDDLLRAVSLLERIRAEAKLPIRAGVTRGSVFAGMVGSRNRCTYTVMGSRVNLAARLMTEASWGDFLFDEELAPSCDFLSFQNLGERSLKGFSRQRIAYKFLGKRKVEPSRYPLVGRKRELRDALDWLREAKEKKSRLCIDLQGEAGIGKSQFCYFLQEALPVENYFWISLPCRTISQHPLSPWKRVLLEKLNLKENPGEEDLGRELKLLVRSFEGGEDWDAKSSIALYSCELLLDLNPTSPSFDSLPARRRRQNLWETLHLILTDSARQRCTVFYVEDSHHMDPESRETLRFMLTRHTGKATVLLLESRSGTGWTQELLDSQFDRRQELCLEGIETEAFPALVKTYLDAQPAPALVAMLQKRTLGNPFFTEQLVKFLRSTSALNSTNRGLEMAEGTQTLPMSVRQVILSRVDQLHRSLVRLIKTASILGREVPIALLSHMLRNPVKGSSCETLQREALWSPLQELLYLFQHSMIQETIYEMQMNKVRTKLHALAVRSLEAIHKDRLAVHAATLAHHCEMAGWIHKSREYHLIGAQEARQNYELEQALFHYQNAQRLSKKKKEQFEMELEIASLQNIRGETREFKDCLKRLEEELSSLRSSRLRIRYELLHSINQERAGNLESALKGLEHCLHLAKKGKFRDLTCESLLKLGAFFQSRGDSKRALDLVSQGLEFSQESGESRLRIQIRNQMAGLEESSGNWRAALKEYEALLKQARLDNSQVDIYHTLSRIGVLHFNAGRVRQAESRYREAMLVAKKIGYRLGYGHACGHLGSIYWMRGDYAMTLKLFQEDLAIGRELGDPQTIGVALGMVGTTYMDLGDVEKCVDHLLEFWEIAQKIQTRQDLVYCSQQLGYSYKLLQEYENSERWFLKSIELCRESNLPYMLALDLYYYSLMLCLQGRFKEALPLVEEAIPITVDVGMRDTFAFRMYLMRIRVKSALGDLGEKEAVICAEALLKAPFYASHFEKSQRGLNRVELHYELSFMTDLKGYRESALKGFESLYAKRSDGEYKTKIEELKSGARVL